MATSAFSYEIHHRRAAELVAAQFDTVAAAAEGFDALAAGGMVPAGVWL